MAVRVKVEIEFENKKMEAVALANAGYETDTEEILLPGSLFKKYWKKKKGEKVRYLTVDKKIATFKDMGKCKVKVITKDRVLEEVNAELLVSSSSEEAILSDALIESLKMVLLKVKGGKWCFKDENIERESEPIQRW